MKLQTVGHNKYNHPKALYPACLSWPLPSLKLKAIECTKHYYCLFNPNLLITITLITLFSVLGIFILETKSLRSENLTNQYLYIQAKNHKNFLKDYIKSIDLTKINHFEIKDDLFDIYAKIEKHNSIFTIHIFVKAKDYNISFYEKVVKE